MVKVSVVIPCFQAAATIDRCMEALAAQTAPRETYEVLVVDDGSTDGSPARVKSHPGVRLIVQDHAGPAAARNMGAQEAEGELLLFTDADCAPAADWIEQMVTPFGDGGNAGAIVGVKGTYRTMQREPVARFVQVEYEDKYRQMARSMARDGTIDFIDTYAAGYRRDLFLANGGFDTGFPVASVEDQEFSFRLARQGYRMAFVPGAHVVHWGHANSAAAYFRKKLRIGYWKVMVHRRHPDKLWRDSHTPQSLKAQILLVAGGGLCLLGGLLWQPALWGLLLCVVAFVLSTIPFVWRAAKTDPVVAALSPALLLVRALALGLGFAAGIAGPLVSRRG